MTAYNDRHSHFAGTRVLMAAWGNPNLESTYRGIPCRLYRNLAERNAMVTGLDLRQRRTTDSLTGAVNWSRSFRAMRPRANQLWRFFPKNIELLTRRYTAVLRNTPKHDVVLQFGVAGIPSSPLVAHVEFSIAQAVADPTYSRTYGFTGYPRRVIESALEGERLFLRQCDRIWTNSEWTAQGLLAQGAPSDRLHVCPPACGVPDPGDDVEEKMWDRPHILFVAADWHGKGGPLLVDAVRIVRQNIPDVALTIIGCDPQIDEPNTTVLGFVRKDLPSDFAKLHNAYKSATIFCMPTHFDTTGVVFFEAAIYAVPSIMLAGQGRERIFPAEMSIQVQSPDPQELAQTLVALIHDPQRNAAMGQFARSYVLRYHTWDAVTNSIIGVLTQAAQRKI